MFYVNQCGTDKPLGQSRTQSEAFALAKASVGEDGYDTYVTDTSTGCSRIIGFGTTGFIAAAPDPTDPCTRGGSVLFGRETE